MGGACCGGSSPPDVQSKSQSTVVPQARETPSTSPSTASDPPKINGDVDAAPTAPQRIDNQEDGGSGIESPASSPSPDVAVQPVRQQGDGTVDREDNTGSPRNTIGEDVQNQDTQGDPKAQEGTVPSEPSDQNTIVVSGDRTVEIMSDVAREEADKGGEDMDVGPSCMDTVELEIANDGEEGYNSVEAKLTFSDLSIDEFNEEARQAFVAGLATEMEVPVEFVRILSVEAGSVIVKLELVGNQEKPAISLLMQVQSKQAWHVCGRDVTKPQIETLSINKGRRAPSISTGRINQSRQSTPKSSTPRIGTPGMSVDSMQIDDNTLQGQSFGEDYDPQNKGTPRSSRSTKVSFRTISVLLNHPDLIRLVYLSL